MLSCPRLERVLRPRMFGEMFGRRLQARPAPSFTVAAQLPRWGDVDEEQCARDCTRLYSCNPQLNQKVRGLIRAVNVKDSDLCVDVLCSRCWPCVDCKQIVLWQGDMTRLKIDGIVNAANSSLLGGGGIDGAIHRAAGRKLLEECRTLHGCDTGKTKVTKGYNLPAAYVLHTVGPIGENPQLLASCYRTVLEQAVARGIRSLCYCCVSTGIYGYPPRAAAHVALKTVREWLEAEEDADNIDLVVFCTFLDSDLRIYRELMPLYFPRVDRADPIEPESGEETKQATRGSDESSPEASVEESDNTAGISGEEKEAISATGAAEPMEMSDLPEQKRPRSEAGETTSQDDGVPMQRASESSRGDAASEPAGAAPGGDSQQASSEHADQPGGEVTGQTQQTDGERTKEA